MEPKFEIYFDRDMKWRFRLIAPNREIIAASEAYNSRQACYDGVAAVKRYAPIAEVIDKTK